MFENRRAGGAPRAVTERAEELEGEIPERPLPTTHCGEGTRLGELLASKLTQPCAVVGVEQV